MNYQNIVFQGGGVKGIAYAGVIKALNDLKLTEHFKKSIGTSVGSICAFLFALKPTNEEIDKYMIQVIEKILKPSDHVLNESLNLYYHYGIHNNDCIQQVIEYIQKDKFDKNNLIIDKNLVHL